MSVLSCLSRTRGIQLAEFLGDKRIVWTLRDELSQLYAGDCDLVFAQGRGADARSLGIRVVLATLCAPRAATAYSVLAHEANIDAPWDSAIVPVLRARFPGVSREQLLEARGYAYGGCVIQDLGYYPFGSQFFSNLLHYVRTGDFIDALIRDAQGVEEFAFALGALSHYAADNDGHPLATNRPFR